MEKTNKLTYTPMDSYNVICVLREYFDLLKSHHEGRYKLIINSCNNKLLSYHQSVTLYHVDFGHPICQFISNFIKELPFSGLYCGIITSAYLRRLLELKQDQSTVTCQREIVIRLDRVQNIVLCFIEKLKKKINLEGHRLISIVKNSLTNLPLDNSYAELLAVSLVKATLLAVDDASQRLGHITIKAVDGRDSCEVYNGVIYKLESLWVPKPENLSNNLYHILLFTEPLEGSEFGIANVTETEFIASIVAAEIKVVACQKPINKRIIFLLKRQNIFALERLGEETANALTLLSSAFPISDLSQIKWNELKSYIGIISRLRKVSILDEDYLLMEKEGSTVVTLFASHRNFDTLDQFKVVLKECIHTLYSIFKAPYFLPEGFETYLSKQLKNYGDTDVLFNRMMALLAESIEESFPNSEISKSNSELHHNNVYLLTRNCLAHAFLIIANILEVGLIVEKNN